MTKKHSNKRAVFLTLLIILIIAAFFGIHWYRNRVILNTDYVNGNTPGNLYNGGLFCESNGTIFFSNPNDNHKLYAMSPTGANLTKISDDVASYINADEHYVYYVRDNGSLDAAFSFLHFSNNSLCRVKRTGGDVTVLDDAPCLYASLVGNYIYYIHYEKEEASTLYRVKINGKEREKISSTPYMTCGVNGQYLYFQGEEHDHNLWQLDSSNNSFSTFHECVCYQPTVTDTTAYYMNCVDDYSITRLDISSTTETTIVPDRVDCYNIYGDYIYYQKNDSATCGLYRCRTDGTEEELIALGNFTSIHVTSQYVYFYEFVNDTVCYKTPTTGAINVTEL